MIVRVNSILFKTSDKVDSMNTIKKKSESWYEYTPKSSYCFKSVILNRSILLGNDYYYFGFNENFKSFYVYLQYDEYPDEYMAEYRLLDNVSVVIDVEKDDADGEYILYIDITSLD